MAFYQSDQGVGNSYAIKKTGDLGLPKWWSKGFHKSVPP